MDTPPSIPGPPDAPTEGPEPARAPDAPTEGPPKLDAAEAKRAIDAAADVPGGKAFYEPSDPTAQAAAALGEFPGQRKYDLHGTQDGVIVPGHGLLDAASFADVVRADPGWQGQPIMLFSCDTGKVRADGRSFAQDLSDDLGVPVTAPTELAWSDDKGSFYSASAVTDADGVDHPNGPPWDGTFTTSVPGGTSAAAAEVAATPATERGEKGQARTTPEDFYRKRADEQAGGNRFAALERELAAADTPARRDKLRGQIETAAPLDQVTPEDLVSSPTLQAKVFHDAQEAKVRQEAHLSAVLDDLRTRTGLPLKVADEDRIVSVLKRDDPQEFTHGILEKCQRKGYQQLGEMPDIVRGRVNLEDGPREPMMCAKALEDACGQPGSPVTLSEPPEGPRSDRDVMFYPRWHTVVTDETGLPFEWQIGTKATTDLFEQKGIDIPPAFSEAAQGHKFDNNLHDIGYDVLRPWAQEHPPEAQSLGVNTFLDHLDEAADRTKWGSRDPDLATDISDLHREAGDVMRTLVDRGLAEELAGMLH